MRRSAPLVVASFAPRCETCGQLHAIGACKERMFKRAAAKPTSAVKAERRQRPYTQVERQAIIVDHKIALAEARKREQQRRREVILYHRTALERADRERYGPAREAARQAAFHSRYDSFPPI